MAQTQERRNKMRQLNTELSNKAFEDFSNAAKKQGISKQELNRRLIYEYLTSKE